MSSLQNDLETSKTESQLVLVWFVYTINTGRIFYIELTSKLMTVKWLLALNLANVYWTVFDMLLFS